MKTRRGISRAPETRRRPLARVAAPYLSRTVVQDRRRKSLTAAPARAVHPPQNGQRFRASRPPRDPRARRSKARSVLTRATIAEPVVVKREGTSHRSQSLILLSFGESAVRENRKRKTQKRRNRLTAPSAFATKPSSCPSQT